MQSYEIDCNHVEEGDGDDDCKVLEAVEMLRKQRTLVKTLHNTIHRIHVIRTEKQCEHEDGQHTHRDRL